MSNKINRWEKLIGIWQPQDKVLEWLDISEECMRKWRRDGKIVSAKVGGKVMINIESIEKQLNQ